MAFTERSTIFFLSTVGLLFQKMLRLIPDVGPPEEFPEMFDDLLDEVALCNPQFQDEPETLDELLRLQEIFRMVLEANVEASKK